MTDDMSMFKKVKDRITDEVNSATNKIQNMQIIDQLANNLSQLNNPSNRDVIIPTQTLPELTDIPEGSHDLQNFRLQHDTSDLVDASCDDELNSEVSPQHQLFDGHLIKRLNNTINLDCKQSFDPISVMDVDNINSDLEDDAEIDLLADEHTPKCEATSDDKEHNKYLTNSLTNYKARYKKLVHTLRQFNQDKKTECNSMTDQLSKLNNQIETLKRELAQLRQSRSNNIETKNLSASSSQSDNIDKSTIIDGRASPQSNNKHARKIKDLEKLIAKCKESLKTKNSQLKILKDCVMKIDQYKDMLDVVKLDLRELQSSYETWTISLAENKLIMHQEIEDKVTEMEKYKAEIKDHQKQLQEQNHRTNSLKSNIQNLESRLVSTSAAHQKERESLIRELNAAKSIALKQQQKEFELQTERIKLDLEKSIEALKLELLGKDEQIVRSAERQQDLATQNQQYVDDLTDAKKTIDDTKKMYDELKVSSDKQSHELSQMQLEAAKVSNPTVDEETLMNLKEIQSKLTDSESRCIELLSRAEISEARCRDLEKEDQKLRINQQELAAKVGELTKVEDLHAAEVRKSNEILTKNEELITTIETLEKKIGELGEQNGQLSGQILELTTQLEQAKSKLNVCENCSTIEQRETKAAEVYEQKLHELTSRLDLMTAANCDQEKAIAELEARFSGSSSKLQSLKVELDESVKHNESLSQIIQENESEMQLLQAQIESSNVMKQELSDLKKEYTCLLASINQTKQELGERTSELNKARSDNNDMSAKVLDLEERMKIQTKNMNETQSERERLTAELVGLMKKQCEAKQQIVGGILSAMKNLDTPESSPGSDKVLEKVDSQENHGDWSQDELNDSNINTKNELPDPLKLLKDLSELALNRTTSYATITQRLHSVLSDKTMLSDELQRLKEELNSLNVEKNQEVQCSLDETERLKTENQALIHDQKAYDDHISSLESEIELLNNQLAELRANLAHQQQSISIGVGTEMSSDVDRDDLEARYEELDELLLSKEAELKQMRKIIQEKDLLIERQIQTQKSVSEEQVPQIIPVPSESSPSNESYVPDSTEFEYLKNIGKYHASFYLALTTNFVLILTYIRNSCFLTKCINL